VWDGCVGIGIGDQVRVGKVGQAMCCGRRNSRLLVSRYIGYISPRIYSQRLPSCSTRNPSQGNLPSEAAQHTYASPPPPSLSSPPPPLSLSTAPPSPSARTSSSSKFPPLVAKNSIIKPHVLDARCGSRSICANGRGTRSIGSDRGTKMPRVGRSLPSP
jgi:hypothetical protein